MISGYCHNGRLDDARALFDAFQGKKIRTWTSMLSGYAKARRFRDAVDMFDEMPEKNVVTYNAMLSGYLENGDFISARRLFDEMFERNVATWNSMISGYVKGRRMREAREVFDVMPERNEVMISWNPNVLSWNALLAGYIHNDMVEEAKELFMQMPTRNIASWAAVISRLMHNGQSLASLELAQMHRLGNIPSDSSFTGALLSCADIGDVEVGRQIHSLSFKAGCKYNLYVGNGLITIYAKCKNLEDDAEAFGLKRSDMISFPSIPAGHSDNFRLEDAVRVFQQMPNRDVVSWTAVISTYVQGGRGEIAYVIS
ncbi:hypothetical protein K7X08_021460 [Anisodus acutangulus]|uniref:Pentatricopeptide repeat-containing protein n=1 Tax=Anisodus acutangulus TaxID=402998 RepID=A0A9Q1M4A1_9SOLA|nr:hypothetical protein K7X08_021460 [Anisodus acutangulus]